MNDLRQAGSTLCFLIAATNPMRCLVPTAAAALADEHRDRNRDRGDSDSRLEHPAPDRPGLTKEERKSPRDDESETQKANGRVRADGAATQTHLRTSRTATAANAAVVTPLIR